MKRTVSVVLALCLFGCGGNAEWSRQGSSPQQAAAELADCQNQAQEATQRDTNIMNDIVATRGNDWSKSGVMSTQMSEFAASNQSRTGDIVNRCMIGKGFVPGG